ncbi:G-type lectin S-receptor-like serine/threonine-protein kinase SD2-5 [Bidens hawaiensis]|uniref:G-type lectin S-receptor-like serine/threonine-protein kinase SD2-5 n=1 Tax=Bidens hawaiensis TaxID=980011 RepID=UPI00404BA26A
MKAPCICYYFDLFLILSFYSTIAQPAFDYPTTANLSTTWTNDRSFAFDRNFSYTNGPKVRLILLGEPVGPRFGCGFYCNGTCTSYLFAVFIVPTRLRFPQPEVVWSANRDSPVSDGAILNLTSTGELVLRDVDGSTVWSTNTTGKSVAGLKLIEGNLVLVNVNNSVVWQSFDYPTDCLVPGQRLFRGQQLIPSVSETNWTSQKGLFSLQVKDKGLFAYVGSNPAQAYFSWPIVGNRTYIVRPYIRFGNGSFSLFFFSDDPHYPDNMLTIPQASPDQYMKLMPDGHLQALEWQSAWLVVSDLLTGDLGDCNYPLACGRNAICSGNQQCSCPVSSSPRIDYFRAVNDRQPDQGCSQITPLTCNATHEQTFIALENVIYFNDIVDLDSVDIETCKQACVNNCSCKAALFQYGSNSSDGDCYLPFELFTMMNVDPNVVHRNTSAFIKVQNVRSPPSASTSGSPRSTLGVALIAIISSVLVMLLGICILISIIRRRRRDSQLEEEFIGEVPGMPNRFSYEELKTATEDFNKKLGEGGFGEVYEGTLEDGSKIAVKCLEGLGHINKSFLAEVQSIGSIHHVNLVTLRGFGAWKSQRFLVYEFMNNGSLERWIYHRDREHVLEWECRKKIILDVAKGLAYLHEECRQKIIHLDIKPQNILLDSDFNAKVSDFGLSKLIDRNQTQVMTTMRGTPGYLAPEWLSSIITEKVDVYSFGVVLLEMLCGRKNFDRSQPEESWHLLSVLQKCWDQGTLLDMVDKYSEDMHIHDLEVVEMMKVASWCLQYDYTKRPSMSTVVKVLEGVMIAESSLDYNFINPKLLNTVVENEKDMTPLLASVLSGPR